MANPVYLDQKGVKESQELPCWRLAQEEGQKEDKSISRVCIYICPLKNFTRGNGRGYYLPFLDRRHSVYNMNSEAALQLNPCLKPGERQSASVFPVTCCRWSHCWEVSHFISRFEGFKLINKITETNLIDTIETLKSCMSKEKKIFKQWLTKNGYYSNWTVYYVWTKCLLKPESTYNINNIGLF